MAYYQQCGSVPPKRHTQHRDAQGRLYFEELMGEEGFSSDSSLLYHREIPSALVDARLWQLPDQSTMPNEPLLPRHLRLPTLFSDGSGTDVVTGRRLVLGNDDVRISYAVARKTSPLYRNAVGDECVYLESGSATVETVFGTLTAVAGDYVLIPRATTHRWVPTGDEALRVYCIEANSHITPARRYLSKFGQLLEHAPFCERDLHGPSEPPHVEGSAVEVYVKHRGAGPSGLAGSVHVTPHHPFDVVGWDGCLYPYTFNVADFEPITGRVHQPPPVHQVFEGANFVICNFVPRKVDYHPLSIPVPYYHANVDSDEVMFYCGGDYEARKGSGIGQGSVSLHPGGHSHGPQPGAYERSIGVQYFDELAVMVDTFRPLRLGEGARASDDGRYAWSWSGSGACLMSGPANAGIRFGIDTLPYGSVLDAGGRRFAAVRFGDAVLDLSLVDAHLFADGSLDAFLASGRDTWDRVRADARRAIEADRHPLVPLADVTPVLAFAVADYVDFFTSEHHAANAGNIFRPDGTGLPPSWPHQPIGYYGRAGSVVVSGTDIRRPAGQYPQDDTVVLGPTRRLDFEAEVAFVVGVPGTAIAVTDADEHVFGVCLLNDWSARDVQGFESIPLGPFLGKSFATSLSAWITPLSALATARLPVPPHQATPLPHLRDAGAHGLALELEVRINDSVVSRPRFADMYWTYAQMLAHLTSNGASVRTGDVYASGTVSGPTVGERGCLLELTWNGRDPLAVGDSTRTWLADGDVVELRARAGMVDLGPVMGRIVP